ncbi:MAG: iron chaperone [Vicinamibacterales bacterium]
MQPLLRRVRATIRKAAPDAIETISYGIPAFKLRRILVYFAAFEHHIGLYPPAKGNAAIEKAAAGVLGDSLVRLRDEMNREFPRALEFRRPGFDETGS